MKLEFLFYYFCQSDVRQFGAPAFIHAEAPSVHTHHCFCTLSAIVSTVEKSKQHLSVMKIILTWKTPRGWGGSLESFTSGSVDHVLGKSPLQRALCHWTLIAMLSPWKECFVHSLFLRTVYSMDFFHPDPSFYIKLINVSPHTVQ